MVVEAVLGWELEASIVYLLRPNVTRLKTRQAEAGPEVPEEAEEAEAHEDVPDDDEADAAVDAAEADPTAAVEVAETPPLGPVKVEDFEPPALSLGRTWILKSKKGGDVFSFQSIFLRARPPSISKHAACLSARKYKLPAEEHELQQAMSQRQVLCIDDPMELGRSLGASFQAQTSTSVGRGRRPPSVGRERSVSR
eukprot:g33709.t1